MPFSCPCIPSLHPNHLYPNNFAQFNSVLHYATWQTLDTCILPFDPQPIIRLLSQPTLVQRLPQFPHLPNAALLTPVNSKSKFYCSKQVCVPDIRPFPRKFPGPLTISLDRKFRIACFTNRPPNTCIFTGTISPYGHPLKPTH